MENKFSAFMKKVNSEQILNTIKKQKDNINMKNVLEKTVTGVVTKILEGQPKDVATENIRKEIIHTIVEPVENKKVIPLVKYANSVLMTNVPKDLKSLKNFKSNVAKTLIADAQKNIEEKNVVDAQIVSQTLKHEQQAAQETRKTQERQKQPRKESQFRERRHTQNRNQSNKTNG